MKKRCIIYILIVLVVFSAGCTENQTDSNETALIIALNDSDLMKSLDNNYSVSSVDKCIQHWEGPDGVHDDEYICVEFQKEIPVNRLKTITAYIDVKSYSVHHIDDYPVRVPLPVNDINYSAHNYTFTKSDTIKLGEKWYPEIIFDSKISYSEIKSIMNEYFNDTGVVWKMYYYEGGPNNYVLYSRENNYADSLKILSEQESVDEEPPGFSYIENPKKSENGNISYLFTIEGNNAAKDNLFSNESFNRLNIAKTQRVLLCYSGEDNDVKKRIVDSLNQINKDYNNVFIIKENSKNNFCDPYYTTANNSGRTWYPAVGFKSGTNDEEISSMLNTELGPDAAFEQRNKEYNSNYYVDLSQYSGRIPDDLNHFFSISTYGWVFYEPVCFTKSLQYYPLTLNTDSNETKERIITSLENEGVIINQAKIAHIGNSIFNDSSFENSYKQYENIYKSDDVVFIVKSFLRG